MTIIIIGYPYSGKSQKAEEIAINLSSEGERVYVATMIPFDKEGKNRIKKHRKQRQGKGITTIECPINVDKLVDEIPVLSSKTILLECLSNLVGNEMHDSRNASKEIHEIAKKIAESVLKLAQNAKNLVIVSNSFPTEMEGYDEDTRRYVQLTDEVNSLLSKKVDETIIINPPK